MSSIRNVMKAILFEMLMRSGRKHYEAYNENYILDVISNSEPKIRKISVEENHE